MEEVEALKGGKAPRVDGIISVMLKFCVAEWLWMKTVIVSVRMRGISLLSVAGKVYDKVVIERVTLVIEGKVRDDKDGFKKGVALIVNQRVAVRQLIEKAYEKIKDNMYSF